MRKSTMMTKETKPEGALSIEEAHKARYTVYSAIYKHREITKRNVAPGAFWFHSKPGDFVQIGWAFENYFHAYAYSLKCKEQAREQPMDP